MNCCTKSDNVVFSNKMQSTIGIIKKIVAAGDQLNIPLNVYVYKIGKIKLIFNIILLQNIFRNIQIDLLRDNVSIINGPQSFIKRNLAPDPNLVSFSYSLSSVDTTALVGPYKYTINLINAGTTDISIESYTFYAKCYFGDHIFVTQAFPPGREDALVINQGSTQTVPLILPPTKSKNVLLRINLNSFLLNLNTASFYVDLLKNGTSIINGKQPWWLPYPPLVLTKSGYNFELLVKDNITSYQPTTYNLQLINESVDQNIPVSYYSFSADISKSINQINLYPTLGNYALVMDPNSTLAIKEKINVNINATPIITFNCNVPVISGQTLILVDIKRDNISIIDGPQLAIKYIVPGIPSNPITERIITISVVDSCVKYGNHIYQAVITNLYQIPINIIYYSFTIEQ